MNLSTTFVALVQTARKTGQVLVIISVLTLLLLIAAGAGLFHPASSQAGVQLATTNGDIHIGSTMQARSVLLDTNLAKTQENWVHSEERKKWRMSMIPVKIEGVRRNFTASSPSLYSASLIDEPGQRLLVFGIERHEALPIVAALNHLTLPRQETIKLMAETLTLLNYKLEEVRIESYSLLPPLYHLCECRLSFCSGETVQEQTKNMRAGDAIGLALLMEAPIFVSDELFKQMGVSLAEGQTPELVFARYLLKQEGITLPEGKKLRLGYSKTPLRDALVKEFKASLFGKAPIFPEEDMEQRKKEYLAFLLGESAQV